VSECDREALIMRRPWPSRGSYVIKEKVPMISGSNVMDEFKGERVGVFWSFPSTFVLSLCVLGICCTKTCVLACNGGGTIRCTMYVYDRLGFS
jgi:hypothetical protein